MKKQPRISGDILSVDLGNGSFAFGRVLAEPLVAFYDLRSASTPPLEEIVNRPILWKIWVMNHAIIKGRWSIIGNLPLEDALKQEPVFFKIDPISKQPSLYQGEREWPATREECEGLERAAVWEPEQVEERLRDHFEGRQNKWVD